MYRQLSMFGEPLVVLATGYVNEDRLDGWGLSEREKQVCRLGCMGLKPKQIGIRLGIAKFTVHTHVQRITLKARVDSWEDVVLLASRPPGDAGNHGLRLVS